MNENKLIKHYGQVKSTLHNYLQNPISQNRSVVGYVVFLILLVKSNQICIFWNKKLINQTEIACDFHINSRMKIC
jgi:hypothetical protein